MLTTDQRNEMRRCIVGPCTEQEKQEIREGLERIGEKVEPLWGWVIHPDLYPTVALYPDEFGNDWGTSQEEPTITAADFIKTYLRP